MFRLKKNHCLQLLKQPADQLRCPIDRIPLLSRELNDYKINYALCEVLDTIARGAHFIDSPEPSPPIHLSEHGVAGPSTPPVDTPSPQFPNLGELASSLPSNGHDDVTALSPVVRSHAIWNSE